MKRTEIAYREPVTSQWVVGRAVGDQAKSIIAHAQMGVGYHILEQGREAQSVFCLYAFRRPTNSPCPDHLTPVNKSELMGRLEAKDLARRGGH